MHKQILLLAFFTLLLTYKGNVIADEGKINPTQNITTENNQTTNENDLPDLENLTGKYASDEGDLKMTVTEGMVLFKLLVVSATGRTGDMEGEMVLKGNTGIYKNESQDCNLQFKFTNQQVEVTQEGSCEMGLGVTASGTYKSMSEANAASVIGKVGDSLGALFYAENETSYRKYCEAGMEEESGNIICKARLKSGEDSNNIVHIFSGKYAGPDGELPPLNVAKGFKLLVTR